MQSWFIIKESRVNFCFFLAKTTRDIVVQNTKPFRAKSKHWRIKMGRKKLYRLFAMYCGSCSLASYCLDRLENSLLTVLQAERDADFVRAFLIAIAKEMSKNVFHLCLMLLPACSMASALFSASPRRPATLRYLSRWTGIPNFPAALREGVKNNSKVDPQMH